MGLEPSPPKGPQLASMLRVCVVCSTISLVWCVRENYKKKKKEREREREKKHSRWAVDLLGLV